MAADSTLRIVCAGSLALGEEYFSRLGRVEVVPESDITRDTVRDADVLATRSKVRVNEDLVRGSRLRFYGTATAGYDHVDTAALKHLGIAWAQAPGSNAVSVAEYVIASLARIGMEKNLDWTGKTLGVIGAGHTGSRLAARAPALGLKVMLNDPPLREQTDDPRYLPLPEVLAAADVVSLHIPLTDSGEHATRGMVDAGFFGSLKEGATFINASRGEVVDERVLHGWLGDGRAGCAVLDVFDHEPDIDLALAAKALVATPHIAGYSYDGRVRGTAMIFDAACRSLGVDPGHPELPAEEPRIIEASDDPMDHTFLYRAILAAYDPAADCERLRSVPGGTTVGNHFRNLRANYPKRLEFDHYEVRTRRKTDETAEALSALGFSVQSAC